MGRRRVAPLLLALALPAATSADPNPGLRVQLGPATGGAMRTALLGASQRLSSEGCLQVLSDFHDRAGRPLLARLEEAGLTAKEHLDRLVFADGRGQGACRHADVIAATMPGSRVVYVCATRFWRLQRRDPVLAEAIVIHELLHTLGLGEGPPESRAITAGVLARCR